MIMDVIKRSGSVVGAVAALVVLCAASGCLMSGNNGAATPYRPVAKPIEINTLRTAPDSTQAAPSPAAPTDLVFSAEADLVGRTLRSGDRILVTIHAPPEPFTSQHVVDELGRINLPYIGTELVAGKSCAQAQEDIEKEYIDKKFYKTVTVIIVPPESEYSISGEVLRPGPYPLTRNLTVSQALARAGRFTEYADKTKIKLIRGSDVVTINAEAISKGLQKDITVIPGDVIEVPKTWY